MSMGRRSDLPHTFSGRAGAARVAINREGYESGDNYVYWGTGAPLWRIYPLDDGKGQYDDRVAYVRANSREAAMAQFPNAQFRKAALTKRNPIVMHKNPLGLSTGAMLGLAAAAAVAAIIFWPKKAMADDNTTSTNSSPDSKKDGNERFIVAVASSGTPEIPIINKTNPALSETISAYQARNGNVYIAASTTPYVGADLVTQWEAAKKGTTLTAPSGTKNASGQDIGGATFPIKYLFQTNIAGQITDYIVVGST